MPETDKTQEKVDPNVSNEDLENKTKKTDLEDSENPGEDIEAKPHEFSDLKKTSASQPPGNMAFVLDIPLEITVELGRTRMLIDELLRLGQGSVIELSKLAGESLDILINQKLIARGEAVVVNEKFGIRLTEIVSPVERIEGLK